MPETTGGGAEIPNIELPSALRITQRLGMLATSNSYREELIPSIAQLQGEAMSPAQLVSNLEAKTTVYAERHQLGIVRLAQEGIPKIIEQLVDNPLQRDAALDAWEALKAKRIAEDEVAMSGLNQPYHRRGLSRHQIRRAKRRGRY